MKRMLLCILIFFVLFPTIALAPSISVQGKPADLFSVITDDPPSVKLFLPIMNRAYNYTINGQVVDAQGQPIPSVNLLDQHGHSTMTDQNGYYRLSGLSPGSYSLAPEKSGYVFTPSVSQVDISSTNATQNFSGITACKEGVVNGDFESNLAWQFSNAGYTSTSTHAGSRAALTGILDSSNNTEGYSSVKQVISIPTNTVGAVLRLWLFPLSDDVVSQGLIEQASMPTIDTATASNDAQYILIRDGSNELLETLLWMRSNTRTWSVFEFNLSKYAGQVVTLEIGVVNDGLGGVTGMYVDDVTLALCDASMSIVETPTQPCDNYFGNSGFEFNGSWSIAPTTYPAGYSTYVANNGIRSMRTGIIYTRADTYSYSDAYQIVSIPSNATSAMLSMWTYSITDESTTQALPELPTGVKFADALLSTDLQYVLVLDRYGYILEWLYRDLSDDQVWTQLNFDLKKYAGRTIRIQFGTYNDGVPKNGRNNVTTMFVDDTVLDVCVPTPTTPPPTPPPGTCTEKFGNNSFESNSDWGVPITAFSAGYSSANAHTGLRSMRAGIIYTRHNRYSYSDAYQSAHIRSGATSARLSMWVYPISERSSDRDIQYILILDRYGNWIDTLLWQRSNTQTWTNHQFDLNRFRGTTVRIQFGVYNDGLGDVTSMYVDDVSLQVCP